MSRNDSVLSILRAARTLLSTKSRWTKCTLARNKKGVPVLPRSSGASSWCLLGALEKCAEGRAKRRQVECYAVTEAVSCFLPRPYRFLSTFNDNEETKHKDVLRLLDRAIKGESGRVAK
jgi:hypothetical protein